MKETQSLSNFFTLSKSLSQAGDTSSKLHTICEWLKALPEIQEAQIILCSDARLPGKALVTESLTNILGISLSETWKTGKNLCFPIKSEKKEPLGALLIKGSDVLSQYEAELNLIGDKLHDILEKSILNEQIERMEALLHPHSELLSQSESDVGFGQGSGQESGAVSGQVSGQVPGQVGKDSRIKEPPIMDIANVLNLPFYIADLQGRFIHANRVFLDLVKFPDVQKINSCEHFFMEPWDRREELKILHQKGRISNFRLIIGCGDNQQISVNESAMLLNTLIFGVFLDVSEFMKVQEKFQEALEMQEFLNDRIMEAAKILHKTQTTTISALARLAEYRDAETGYHLQRIGEYSRLLAAQIKEKNPLSYSISEDYVSDISISSMLHDIGKVAVPDSILLKPGSLNKEEWDIMKNHTTWGWAILDKADRDLGEQSFLTLATTVALHHHERYDGRGYPKQLSGEDIPLSARIVAIADVYDALTTKRPYKDPWTHERAVEEIYKQKGRQFCPVLIELFPEVEEEFRKIREKFSG